MEIVIDKDQLGYKFNVIVNKYEETLMKEKIIKNYKDLVIMRSIDDPTKPISYATFEKIRTRYQPESIETQKTMDENELIENIMERLKKVREDISLLHSNRELSLAITKLDEAALWFKAYAETVDTKSTQIK